MKIDWNNISEDRMLLDIDLNEFEFIKGAVREKGNRLLNNLDALLHYRLNELEEKPTLKDIDPQVTEIFNKEYSEFKNKTKKAPYGYKVDGTPKKKPGRKV